MTGPSGSDGISGLPPSLHGRLFRDAEFAELYCLDNGCPSVPPRLLATKMLLQAHDKVSDAEAKTRADFDIRGKSAREIEIEERPFTKSTLQVFRTHLFLRDKVREVLGQGLCPARAAANLKQGRGMRMALDTTYILGWGAVKDTYNLPEDGIVKLMQALAMAENVSFRPWVEVDGYKR